MNYLVSANSDIGNVRQTNQDSVSVLRANTSIGEVAFAAVCDGMGGLAKGEMASATVLNSFNNWFNFFIFRYCNDRFSFDKCSISISTYYFTYGI